MNQEINKTWSINGIELLLDMDDLETFEKYEDSFNAMEKEEKTIPLDGKRSLLIRGYCDLYYHLFETLFSKEVADKLVKNRYHMGQWEEVYDSFLNFVSTQVKEINERRNTRFKLSQNRKARRQAQRKS